MVVVKAIFRTFMYEDPKIALGTDKLWYTINLRTIQISRDRCSNRQNDINLDELPVTVRVINIAKLLRIIGNIIMIVLSKNSPASMQCLN